MPSFVDLHAFGVLSGKEGRSECIPLRMKEHAAYGRLQGSSRTLLIIILGQQAETETVLGELEHTVTLFLRGS